MVLIFSGINKAQIYKTPYRDSPDNEIEVIMKFDYLNVFKQNEHTEDYHIRKLNGESFPFEIRIKKYF